MNATSIDAGDSRSGLPPEQVRSCDGCTLCCKVMSIYELEKPSGEWCGHCRIGVGCSIYDGRPTECRQFLCGYLVLSDLSEEWKPSRSKIVITSEVTRNSITFHVDPSRPDAWRREPFYSYMKQRAERAASQRGQVLVIVGKRSIMIFPDRDVDLGNVGDDELIVTGERQTLQGIALEAGTMKRDDPFRRQIETAEGGAVYAQALAEGRLKSGITL
jgi:hypothetical protein